DKEFIGSRGTLAVEEVDIAASTITVIGDWRSNHANGRSKFVFDVVGDKLAKMTIREGCDPARAFRAGVQPVGRPLDAVDLEGPAHILISTAVPRITPLR